MIYLCLVELYFTRIQGKYIKLKFYLFQYEFRYALQKFVINTCHVKNKYNITIIINI